MTFAPKMTLKQLNADGNKLHVKSKRSRCNDTQNHLRHWLSIHTPFGETRLRKQNC